MNEKIIKIGDKEVGFKINAAILYLYKESFGEEYLIDLNKINKSYNKKERNLCLQLQYRVEWCMAKLYDKSIPPIMEWLEQFSFGDYKVDDVWTEILPMITGDMKVDRKNE